MEDCLIKLAKWIAYWLGVILVSLLITSLVVWLVLDYSDYLFNLDVGVNESDSTGARDLGLGLKEASHVIVTFIVSYVAVWPMAVWLTHKLLSKLIKRITRIQF